MPDRLTPQRPPAFFLKVAQTNLLCAIPATPEIPAAPRQRTLFRDSGQQVPGCCSQCRNKMKQNEEARSFFLKALKHPVNFSTQATLFRHECEARVKNAPETQIKSAPPRTAGVAHFYLALVVHFTPARDNEKDCSSLRRTVYIQINSDSVCWKPLKHRRL